MKKVKEQQDFKFQMESDIIPFVKGMIEKEQQHLKLLQKSHKDFVLSNKNRIFYFRNPLCPQYHQIDFEGMINKSYKVLLHLETRLQEYVQYCK